METLAGCFQDPLRGSAKLDAELGALPLQCVHRDSFYHMYIGSESQDKKATHTHRMYCTYIRTYVCTETFEVCMYVLYICTHVCI